MEKGGVPMMDVKVYVTPTTAAAQSTRSARTYTQTQRTDDRAAGRAEAHRNEFFQLLTTQLKYQDPLNPVMDTEFIAQLAQFSTLEELQGLNRRIDEMVQLQLWVSGMGQATTLIGRHVTLELADGTRVEGTVEAVTMRNGAPYLRVGDREYLVTTVVAVR